MDCRATSRKQARRGQQPRPGIGADDDPALLGKRHDTTHTSLTAVFAKTIARHHDQQIERPTHIAVRGDQKPAGGSQRFSVWRQHMPMQFRLSLVANRPKRFKQAGQNHVRESLKQQEGDTHGKV